MLVDGAASLVWRFSFFPGANDSEFFSPKSNA
jgi:hypothetical protein